MKRSYVHLILNVTWTLIVFIGSFFLFSEVFNQDSLDSTGAAWLSILMPLYFLGLVVAIIAGHWIIAKVMKK